MSIFDREISRQINNRNSLIEGMKPFEIVLQDKMHLTMGLGQHVQKYYRHVLRSVLYLNDALERLSMEPSSIRARTYQENLRSANLPKVKDDF